MSRRTSWVWWFRGAVSAPLRFRVVIATVALNLAFWRAGAQTIHVAGTFAVPPGFSMIAYQVHQGDNTVGTIFVDGEADGAAVFKYDPVSGTFAESVWREGAWSDPTMTLLPGEGAFFYNPTDIYLEWGFAGTVEEGQETNGIPAGLSIRSSIVRRSGRLQRDLNFPAVEGDIIYRHTTNGTYLVYTYDMGSWTAEPVVNEGESFWVWKTRATNWVQTFKF
jgi:hypothetical protein